MVYGRERERGERYYILYGSGVGVTLKKGEKIFSRHEVLRMPTEIKTEGTEAKVVRLEATADEVEEIWVFDDNEKFIGTSYRLKTKESTP